MRVCLITSFPPKKSGIAHYSKALHEELSKLVDVDVLKWNFESFFEKLLAPITNLPKLKKALLEYDIIHVQYHLGEYMFLFLPVLCLLRLFVRRKRKKAKIVLTLHEDYLNLPFHHAFVCFHNIFYRCADMLLVHTKLHKALLPESLQSKTEKIDFGVKPESENSEYREKRKQARNIILLPGFINPWKGHDLMIRAMPLIIKEVPDAKLIIVGKDHDKKYAKKIESLIKELELESYVELRKEFIPEKEYNRIYRAAKLCVLPYRRITMSAVLSDIIGKQKPVILSNLEPFMEYTQNNALYFSKDDYKDLAKRLLCL